MLSDLLLFELGLRLPVEDRFRFGVELQNGRYVFVVIDPSCLAMPRKNTVIGP